MVLQIGGEIMNNKLTLGLDIDGTITDPATFIPHINKAFNKHLSFKDITQFHLSPLYGITDKEFFSWFSKNAGPIYAQAELAESAKEILTEWKETHHLIYISARHKKHHELTLNWFTEHSIPFDEILLTGSHNKIEMTKDKGIELFFEDKLDNANEIAEAVAIPVLLFNTPYNQGNEHSLVHRVTNWLEAKSYVDQYVRRKGS